MSFILVGLAVLLRLTGHLFSGGQYAWLLLLAFSGFIFGYHFNADINVVVADSLILLAILVNAVYECRQKTTNVELLILDLEMETCPPN